MPREQKIARLLKRMERRRAAHLRDERELHDLTYQPPRCRTCDEMSWQARADAASLNAQEAR
jgi:hypothetical protein